MKKVYCIISDYQGCNEQLKGIYEEEKNAIERLTAEFYELEYGNAVDFMRENDLSLVEWECGSNTQRLIRPSYDW